MKFCEFDCDTGVGIGNYTAAGYHLIVKAAIVKVVHWFAGAMRSNVTLELSLATTLVTTTQLPLTLSAKSTKSLD